MYTYTAPKRLFEPQKDHTFGNHLVTILCAFAVCVLWIGCVDKFYEYLFKTRPAFSFQWFKPVVFIHQKLIAFISACIFAPLWEELIFRKTVIDVFKRLDGGRFLSTAIFASSIIFGLGHSMGTFSLPVQGVLGIALSVVYIKNGYCYKSAVCLHFLWNASLYFDIIG